MSEDCESQSKRQEQVRQDIDEVKDTIEQLKEACDDLDEQILKVSLRSNQAVNEKMRLEIDFQKYKKLGKQPKAKSNSQQQLQVRAGQTQPVAAPSQPAQPEQRLGNEQPRAVLHENPNQ